jgi:23S rRNA (cytidine1920-2'-O)/16S rRNA (cytidine1409-2'-O)-methyltransferase
MVDDKDAARRAIAEGRVSVGGLPAVTPTTLVAAEEALRVRSAGETDRYVSRGGEKLAAALDRFGVPVEGRVCLDAGASTGGFTDCLLRRGARLVVAVDVGYGQLAWSLREDPRVTVLERTNVRTLDPDTLPIVELVVVDLSFVSLRTALPDLLRQTGGDEFLVLVKPQFEAAPHLVGAGGVVESSAVRRDVLEAVVRAGDDLDLTATGVMASPLRGPAGNVEFFVRFERGRRARAVNDQELDEAVADGERLRA